MAVRMGLCEENPDAGALKGRQEPVACGVWYTSSGRIMPKLMKFQDKEGMLHTVAGLHVISREENYFCGIPAIRFECDAVFEGRRIRFCLLFYVERQEWKLLWRDKKERQGKAAVQKETLQKE